MKPEQASHISSPAATLVRQLSDSIDIVFGEGHDGRIWRQKCQLALDEINAGRDRRGVKSTSIAVLGSKNTGKSWLCRQLVQTEAKREKIASGEESDATTALATWIGSDAPPALVPEHERRILVRREEMVDLGRDYTLLDLPGYDDAGVGARDAALRAIRGVEFRIMVFSSKTKGDESQFAYLRDSDGTRILPVIVDGKFPQLETVARSEVEALVSRIKRKCPHAEVSDAVIIPHVEHAPGNATTHLARARERLFPALRAFIALEPVDEEVIGRVVLERLRRELAGDLRNFAERVAPAHMALETREAELAGELVSKLLGSDPQLAAGLRMKMRLFTLSKTPGWFFPYRSFFGLFAFTAGAWDRLAFAMAGSLPSLALLAFQTARNAKKMGEMKEDIRNSLASRLQRMADSELAASNRLLVRSIRSTLQIGTNGNEDALLPTRFVGLERVTSDSGRIFDAVISRLARTRGLPLLLGGLATLAFIALAAGPLWVVYREFFQAWTGGLSGAGGVNWTAFPAPSTGMIFATVLLVLLPVALLALISSVISTPQRLIHIAAEEVRKEHDMMLKQLAQEQVMRLESDDPVREAVRLILEFLNSNNLSPE
jgi:hypothetical protein